MLLLDLDLNFNICALLAILHDEEAFRLHLSSLSFEPKTTLIEE